MRTYVARVWPFNKGMTQAFTVTQRIIGFPTGVVVLLMRFLLWVFWVRLCKHEYYLTMYFLPVTSQMK